jgi:ATP-dependent 26S proteasome regulatory subunit
LQVARCTKIIQSTDDEGSKYVINVKQIAKFVVELGERVSPTDIEEGMRVGYVKTTEYMLDIDQKYNIVNNLLSIVASIERNIKYRFLYHQRLIHRSQ